MKDIILFRGEPFSTYIRTYYLEEVVSSFCVCDTWLMWPSGDQSERPIGIFLIRKEGSYVHFM